MHWKTCWILTSHAHLELTQWHEYSYRKNRHGPNKAWVHDDSLTFDIHDDQPAEVCKLVCTWIHSLAQRNTKQWVAQFHMVNRGLWQEETYNQHMENHIHLKLLSYMQLLCHFYGPSAQNTKKEVAELNGAFEVASKLLPRETSLKWFWSYKKKMAAEICHKKNKKLIITKC